MFNRVVLIALMLISTGSFAHSFDYGKCEADLSAQSPSQRIESYGQLLTEMVSFNELLYNQFPSYRSTSSDVAKKLVALQAQLGRVRTSENDKRSRELEIFETRLRQAQPMVLSSFRFGESLVSLNLNRGRQHPDRPMKRETLAFYQMDGLENWPYDFTYPEPASAPSATTASLEEWPALRAFINWPPRERP